MALKIRSAARGFSFPTWSIPIALLVLTLVSYGLRAFTLGFFWDDWPYLWFFHRFGPIGIINAFEGDRPFLSFIYNISLTFLGNSSLAWQTFALLARWLCSLGLWWVLWLTWPKQANKTIWAAFLFAVYPGFTQQWIALIYGQAFFLFAALFFSIGITIWLARFRDTLARGWIVAGTLLALALSAFTMFSTEYFYGLELLRPALLWLVLRDTPEPKAQKPGSLKSSLLRAAAWWSPYLALMVIFALWRGVIHPFTGYSMTTVNKMGGSPFETLLTLAISIVRDLSASSFAAWGQPLQQMGSLFDNGRMSGARLLAIILFTGLLCAFYLIRLCPRPALKPGEEDLPAVEPGVRWAENWGLQATLLGLYAMLAAGWPMWLTGLPTRMGFPLDRYSLAFSVGVCILLAGLVDLLGGRTQSTHSLLRKAALISIAVGLAAGFHDSTALLYRQDWQTVRDFFWQLTWRAPSVQPNTLFVSNQMPFKFFEDDSLTAPLNWTYDPAGKSTQMPYMLYDLLTRHKSMPDLIPDQKIWRGFRAAEFNGSTSQMLVFSYAPPGCVRILDPVYDAEEYNLSNQILQALPVSKPSLIEDSQTPAAPPAIFGKEPKHEWCYYFEKAELARQARNWGAIITLSNQSIHKGYRPKDPIEYLPFIEAYAQVRSLDDAFQLTESAYTDSIAVRPALCAAWQRASQNLGGLSETYKDRLKSTLSCSIP